MNPNITERIQKINSGIVPEGYKKTKVGIVPVEWEIKQMKRICEINRGGSPRPIEDFLTDGKSGINWIKIGDVSADSKYITHTKERIKLEGVKKSRQVFEGDFLLSNSMSYGRPYILKTAGCIHDGWLVINNYSKFFELDFFYYLLCSESIQRQYDVLSAGSGVQNLNKDLVSEVNVILPPLPEQQKIAEILSTQDKLIELLEKKIEQLKELKKGYLQKMFPAKGSKYPELRFRGFTDAWEQRVFGDLAEYKKGPFGSAITKDMFVPKSDLSVKVYEQQNAINKDWTLERYFLPKEYVITKLKSFEVHGGDIIVSCAGTIGEIYEIPINAECGIINQALMRVRVNEDVVGKKLFTIVFSNMIEAFSSIHSNGSAIKNIPPFADLKPMEVLIPSIEEQKKIENYFCNLDTLITLHQRKLEQEKQKKKALMQLLLTGKVRVKT